MPRRAVKAPGRQSEPLVWVALAMALMLGSTSVRAADPSLHEQIDSLVESTSPGPLARPAGDADFLRRVYLDLNGTIPDAATTRAFLDDPAADKRQALIDRLLARPQFARHMQRVFDVMLLERRPEKGIPLEEWREYLRKSFENNKPLDQLMREILGADGSDPATRAAAGFYLGRDADANLLARDVGRLFFARDMQCAQCHDHPLIEDYLQADYYGLLAFVNRGSMFTGQDKRIYYAESAEGEVNYKSVFTGDARDHVLPKLPRGAPVSEPMLAKAEQYVVAPEKTVRGVPRYSRRAQLSTLTTSGASAAFNRNLANRLWAHMLGRGVVHPLDMEHSGNPAVQSQMLSLLADELVRMKFDTKGFLRELALSRAYQRSSEPAAATDLKIDSAAATASVTAWRAEADKLTAELEALKTASGQASGALNAAYEEYSKHATVRDAAEKQRAESKKISDDLSAVLAKAIKDVTAKDEALKALVDARDKAAVVVAKLPEDKEVAEAAKLYRGRVAKTDEDLTTARKTVAEKQPQVQAASLKLAEFDKAVEASLAPLATARTALDAADALARESQEKYRAARSLAGELKARIADAESALTCQTLAATAATSKAAASAASDQLAAMQAQTENTAEAIAQLDAAVKGARAKADEDHERAEHALASLVERGTVRFTLAPLKPLSPEQLATATMQALGVIDVQRAAVATEVKTAVDAMTDLSPEGRQAAEQRLLESKADEKLRGSIGPFVSLFGQQPGQAPAFQSTVHQALFLSNGGLLASWLNPAGGNLTDRLAKIEQPAGVADELYLSILTRRPTEEEQVRVAVYLEEGKADRPAALRELVWSLVTSAEFRFSR